MYRTGNVGNTGSVWPSNNNHMIPNKWHKINGTTPDVVCTQAISFRRQAGLATLGGGARIRCHHQALVLLLKVVAALQAAQNPKADDGAVLLHESTFSHLFNKPCWQLVHCAAPPRTTHAEYALASHRSHVAHVRQPSSRRY